MGKEYKNYTHPSGLRLVYRNTKSKVAHFGCFMAVGSTDESRHEIGMAHLVEHLFFKGTKRKSSYQILKKMDDVGGELNAYTEKENTVLYSSFLNDDYKRAIELILDVVFNSVFPKKEIDKEIDVVIDEIHSYLDSPSELIYDEFENQVFQNTPLGHSILGTEESLETFNEQLVKDFYERNYTIDKMVFFFQGDVELQKIFKYIDVIIAKNEIRKKDYSIATRKEYSISDSVSHVKIDKGTSQSHVIIGCPSVSIFDERKWALSLANSILGGPGTTSRFNINLREKRGYVYTVESILTPYTSTGLFSIYLGCDKKNEEKCMSIINRELNKMSDKKLTTNQIHLAKKQLLGQIAIASENTENMALALGRNFYHFQNVPSLSDIFTKIDKVTASEVLQVCNEIISVDKMSSLTFH